MLVDFLADRSILIQHNARPVLLIRDPLAIEHRACCSTVGTRLYSDDVCALFTPSTLPLSHLHLCRRTGGEEKSPFPMAKATHKVSDVAVMDLPIH